MLFHDYRYQDRTLVLPTLFTAAAHLFYHRNYPFYLEWTAQFQGTGLHLLENKAIAR